MTTEKQAKKIEVRRIREEAVRRCSEEWVRQIKRFEWQPEIERFLVNDILSDVYRDLIPYLYGKEY